MANRKEIEKYILDSIDKRNLDPENKTFYIKKFKSMNDKEFNIWMTKLRDGEIRLAVIRPVDSKKTKSMTNKKVIKMARDFGIEPWQYVISDPIVKGAPRTKSIKKRLILLAPSRRTGQTRLKKMGVPKHINTKDTLTGQVTGASTGAKITAPEAGVLASVGMKVGLIEMEAFRGGDRGGERAFMDSLATKGYVSLAEIESQRTGVESKNTLKEQFKGAQLILDM